MELRILEAETWQLQTPENDKSKISEQTVLVQPYSEWPELVGHACIFCGHKGSWMRTILSLKWLICWIFILKSKSAQFSFVLWSRD